MAGPSLHPTLEVPAAPRIRMDVPMLQPEGGSLLLASCWPLAFEAEELHTITVQQSHRARDDSAVVPFTAQDHLFSSPEALELLRKF